MIAHRLAPRRLKRVGGSDLRAGPFFGRSLGGRSKVDPSTIAPAALGTKPETDFRAVYLKFCLFDAGHGNMHDAYWLPPWISKLDIYST